MKKIIYIICTLLVLASCSTNLKDDSDGHIVLPTSNPDDKNSDEIFVFQDQKNDLTVDSYTNFASIASFNSTNMEAQHTGDFAKHEIKINGSSTKIGDVSFTNSGIFLQENNDYILHANIESNVEKTINIKIKDTENNLEILNKNYKLKIGNNTLKMDFTSSKLSYTGLIEINMGSTNFVSEELINISNLGIDKINKNISIKVNQLGYLNDEKKLAVFSVYDGDYFNVFNADSNQIVYTGSIVGEKTDIHSQEIIAYGDFSDIIEDGKYYIISQYGNSSYNFEINNKIYDHLLKDTLKMISSQRCGHDLPAEIYGDLAHEICHSNYSQAFGYEHMVDTTGGWHDAGDYGKYTNTILKVISELMMSQLINPNVFSDEMNILESNNGISDILDEIKSGMDYLLKIQTNDGGIYHKVSPKTFSDFVLPEDDLKMQYAMEVHSNTTAHFAAVAAMASKLFEGIDDEFAKQSLDASLKAYEYMENNGFVTSVEQEGFRSGVYVDNEDISERYYMNMALWYVTLDEMYLDNAMEYYYLNPEIALQVDYTNPGAYGTYLFVSSPNSDKYSEFKNELGNALIGRANYYKEMAKIDGYMTSIDGQYIWNSNSYAANKTMIMLLAYNINNDIELKNAAYDQLHYFLGRNALNQSFITNEGDNYPTNIHHRFTMTKNVEIPGALVGGPNMYREDNIVTSEYNEKTPPAKSYLDDENSYSTNEVTIYTNSTLVFIISCLQNN